MFDEDGERSLSILTTPGVMEWDVLGLCRYGVGSVCCGHGVVTAVQRYKLSVTTY